MTTKTELESHGLAPNPPGRVDSRPDEEIITELNTHIPVTSERNVWIFWDTGFEGMPAWIRRSVIDCVRRQGASWTVRLLDTVPMSPNHVLKFASEADFPASFIGGPLLGKDGRQHISDFARLAIVFRHGGIYIDAGVILLRDLDEICWSALIDPASPYQVAGMAQQMGKHFGQMLNSFIGARRRNPFIYRWQQVFLSLWMDRNRAAGLHGHPLISHLPLLQISAPTIPAGADWADFTDYLAQVQAFERVRLNQEPGVDGFDGPEYFREHFFLLDARTEMFLGQAFDEGDRVRRLLLLPRREPPDDEDQEAASRFVYGVLAESSCCKFSKGTGRLGLPTLVAEYWTRPEYANDDCQPGTWGEYLRYGSVHFRQTRQSGRSLTPLHIPKETAQITRAGTFEPISYENL